MAAARSPSRAAAAILASDALAGIKTGETKQASRNPVSFRFIDRSPNKSQPQTLRNHTSRQV